MSKRNKYIIWLFVFLCIAIILLSFFGNGLTEGFDDNTDKSLPHIKYYVITMGQPKRLENIRKETEKINALRESVLDKFPSKIEFEIINAVNGDDLDLKKMVADGKIAKEVLTDSSYKGFGVIEKRKYEVGCYLSHIRTYETIKSDVDSGILDPKGYSIIFEDDLEIQDGYFTELQKAMNFLTKNRPDFDMLFLGLHSDKNDLIGDNVYRPNCKNIYNCYYSHAYLIPNDKVSKIMNMMEFIDNTVDIKMIDLSENGGLNVFRVMPDIVNQNSPTTGSIIRDG